MTIIGQTEVYNHFADRLEKLDVTKLGLRLMEGTRVRHSFEDIPAVVFPGEKNDEVIISHEFLEDFLKCKRIVIDYEDGSFRIIN